MSTIILDFGSGNTCRNDKDIVVQMYDELQKIDAGKHDIIVKWQLFEKMGKDVPNIPLSKQTFDFAYLYGQKLGYPVTASVSDLNSLKFLLQYDIPFVKIANDRSLDWLIGEIPRRVLVYVSVGESSERNWRWEDVIYLRCISKYPASADDYEMMHDEMGLCNGISDHTTDFTLWYKYNPVIIEWHYKLVDSVGLDAGPFARTPQQLREVLQ